MYCIVHRVLVYVRHPVRWVPQKDAWARTEAHGRDCSAWTRMPGSWKGLQRRDPDTEPKTQ